MKATQKLKDSYFKTTKRLNCRSQANRQLNSYLALKTVHHPCITTTTTTTTTTTNIT
jgi:hypothetical protein